MNYKQQLAKHSTTKKHEPVNERLTLRKIMSEMIAGGYYLTLNRGDNVICSTPISTVKDFNEHEIEIRKTKLRMENGGYLFKGNAGFTSSTVGKVLCAFSVSFMVTTHFINLFIR